MAHGRAQKGKKEIYGRKKCKMEGRGGKGGGEEEGMKMKNKQNIQGVRRR
jgi:hypothetical protein